MITFTVSTFINRPQQEVFDFMTNPANNSKWQTGTKSGKWSSEGPIGVGSISQGMSKMLGREITWEGEVTKWNPPSVWGFKGGSGSMKMEGTTMFESKDDGTLVRQTIQGELGGLFNIAEGMAIKQMQKQIEADGNALKKLLETRK